MVKRLFVFLLSVWSAVSFAEDKGFLPLLEDRGWAEHELLQALKSIHQMSPDEALVRLEALIAAFPNYRLAQLMRADLLAIKAGGYRMLGSGFSRQKRKQLAALWAEAAVRWQSLQNDRRFSQSLLKRYVLKAGKQPYLVIVNTAAHRLFLFRQSERGFDEVANYYISIGRKGAGKQVEGDLKTPIGVYRIVKHIDDHALPELYGVGALTLDYPNNWDKQLGRTGSGIWMHGTPRTTYSRPPMDSRGCVVLNNPQMQDLVDQFRLSANTPVLILDEPLASSVTATTEASEEVLPKVQGWLASRTDGVDWSSVNVFRYPGEQAVFWVSYQAKDLSEVEAYWQKKADQWQLVLQKITPRIVATSN